MAKVLTQILKPPVGKSSTTFIAPKTVEQANKITLLPGECLNSYEVTTQFTSVPVDPALGIIGDLLKKTIL